MRSELGAEHLAEPGGLGHRGAGAERGEELSLGEALGGVAPPLVGQGV